MIKSMTGYGYGSSDQKSYQINIEIRSVNARFLEHKIRGHIISPKIDKEINKILKKK